MIDTINPMNFDLTKNLHGHVRVETRDRWTGRVVDSQEKDNLITNALRQVLEVSLYTRSASNALSSVFYPIYSNSLGGLLCFDGTLTESASNIHVPSNVKIVGWGDQGADSSLSWGGSFNGTESVSISNGYTSVWDFATSQANGTIASLARTHSTAKGYPAFYTALLGVSDGMPGGYLTNPIILGYDETNKYLYLTVGNSTIVGGISFTTDKIYRAVVDFSKVGLISASLPPASQLEVVKTLASSDGSTSAANYQYDKWANNFIYLVGTTLHVVAMDGTHTTKTLSGTGSNLCAATEHYYWRVSSDALLRYTKANTAEVQSFPLNFGNYSYTGVAAYENDICVTIPRSSAGKHYFVYPDGTYMEIPTYYSLNSSVWVVPVGRFASATALTQLNFNSLYLGTIANLDSPVTKTSSQTMKITYTLTEA